MNCKETGQYYELIAVNWYRRRGFRIFARNLRTHFGEIDLIAQKGSTLTVVEVRGRTDIQYKPHRFLSHQKLLRVRSLSAWACKRFNSQINIDFVEVIGRPPPRIFRWVSLFWPKLFGVRIVRFRIA